MMALASRSRGELSLAKATPDHEERTMSHVAVFEPSAEEIRVACMQIQKTWSERERLRRRQASADMVRYVLPYIHVRSANDGRVILTCD
jgi:hypothetical protein